MNITRWEPFREMEDMLRQLQPRMAGGSAEHASRWRPTANISETDSEYLIKAELPEVSKEDIQVQVHDGVLTLRGERKCSHYAVNASSRSRLKNPMRCGSRASTANLRAVSPSPRTWTARASRPSAETASCACICRRPPRANANP